MKSFWMSLAILGFLGSMPPLYGAGFQHDENFTVLADDERLAAEVLASANQYRQQIAEQWLRLDLPPGVGETVIHLTLSDREDRGLTWAIDSPNRSLHKIWLTTDRNRALGSTLQHEIAHIVLATRYPQQLPAWAEEGVASFYDDPERLRIRQQLISWFRQTGNWPSLPRIFEKPVIVNTDTEAYTAAASVTEFLVSKADRPTFVEFAAAGYRGGWDQALEEFYEIPSMSALQRQWQDWVAGGGTPVAPKRPPRSPARALSILD